MRVSVCLKALDLVKTNSIYYQLISLTHQDFYRISGGFPSSQGKLILDVPPAHEFFCCLAASRKQSLHHSLQSNTAGAAEARLARHCASLGHRSKVHEYRPKILHH